MEGGASELFVLWFLLVVVVLSRSRLIETLTQKRLVKEPTPCPSIPPDTGHSTSNDRGRSPRADPESVVFGHKIPTGPRAHPSRSRSAHWGLASNKKGELRHMARRQSFADPRRASNISAQSRIPQVSRFSATEPTVRFGE